MEIKAGETVVFVGPSGCGKSTTLKMINRLIEPTGGRIRIGGEDVTDMDPVKLRRRIGYAIQSSGLFPHMTVAQNIALVPRMTGWPTGRIKARVEEMLDLVGLDPGEFHDRYPRQLSGGQQQRVGVARALAADPPVLLMDEPFGAVDPITRDHLQDELIRLQHELHKTIVFVTHDFDEAIKLGDRIAVLRERSHIAQFDTPEAILTNPADDFVSGFVGAGAALKRLNLTRVRNVEITDYPTVAVDDPLQEIFNKLRSSGTNEILLLDRRRRPYKWLRRGDLMRARGSLARAGTLVSDTVTRDATLRDALEAVLTDNAGRVAVTGRRGEYEGVVDMETLMNSVHELLEADRLEAARGAGRTGGGPGGPDARRAGGRRQGGRKGRGGADVTTPTALDPETDDPESETETETEETSAAPAKSLTGSPELAADDATARGPPRRAAHHLAVVPAGRPGRDLRERAVERPGAEGPAAARGADGDLDLLRARHRDPAGRPAHPQGVPAGDPGGDGGRQHGSGDPGDRAAGAAGDLAGHRPDGGADRHRGVRGAARPVEHDRRPEGQRPDTPGGRARHRHVTAGGAGPGRTPAGGTADPRGRAYGARPERGHGDAGHVRRGRRARAY